MDYKDLIVKKEGRIAQVIFNRPEQRNSLTFNTLNELYAAFTEVDKDDNIGVVFLRGAGTNFCAGLDLKFALGRTDDDNFEFRKFEALIREVQETIENLSKPVIAAVHGSAIAGGFIFAYFCDLIVATEDSVFGDAHALWGILPGAIEPQIFARKFSIAMAKRFFLTGDKLTAKEAQEIGLLYKVYPTGKLDDAVEEMGAKFAKLSTLSIAMIKKQLSGVLKADWQTMIEKDTALRVETPGITHGLFTDEAKERLLSFTQKSKGD
jgi:enoyl-CoA hydratase/carnithine racemase